MAPLLLRQFTLRIFDLRPPVSGSGYVHGDATDDPALLAAMADVDAIVHCAMGPVDGAEADVAAAAYQDPLSQRLDESVAPDARDVYGLTKRPGEEVCRAAAIIAALDYRDGFQAFVVSGDDIGGRWSTEKARTLLGWRPEFDTARMNRVTGR